MGCVSDAMFGLVGRLLRPPTACFARHQGERLIVPAGELGEDGEALEDTRVVAEDERQDGKSLGGGPAATGSA